MEKINLSLLNAEQKAALMEELKLQERLQKEAVRMEREAYKGLVGDAVNDVFPGLEETAAQLAKQKADVYAAFGEALKIKGELFNVNIDKQKSHTFINADNTRRITLGTHETDAYDDTVEAGIAKVKEYIGSLARDKDSKMLVDAILKLLSRDQQGNLKASRVVQLQRMAEQSGDEGFLDGVRIIRDAYRPQVSKTYVRAEKKDEKGAWVTVPLGMTEAK